MLGFGVGGQGCRDCGDGAFHVIVIRNAHDIALVEPRNGLEERRLGAAIAPHASVGLLILDAADADIVELVPALSFVDAGQLCAHLAADGLGVHSDIRHHFLVAGVDVVVDGDQPDARFLRLF